ncbi:MAG: hypothetical protein ABEJ31_10525 [Haloarculaceae archaeon]
MTSLPNPAATDDASFTFDWYGDFLDDLRGAGRSFADYDRPLADGDVILRHDVDLSPRNALRIGRMEARRDVRATYFFLVSSPLYNPLHRPVRRVIEELESLGHDVGLHFSTHQYWPDEPPESALVDRVESEWCVLDRVADDPTDAVSFHRPPEWVFRRAFDAFESTYAERFFTDIGYYGDSNQRWRAEGPAVETLPDRVQILTHPGLWGETDAGFVDRVRSVADRRLGRTRRFVDDQFVEKKYNVEEFCEFVDGPR